MKTLNTNFISIEQAAGIYLQKGQTKEANKEKVSVSFEDVLKQTAGQTTGVKFSKHANERLNTRNIELSDSQLDRLNQGVGQARTKQIHESLVMMDNLAFIVNVKNNTVVTAMEQNEENNIFTNIDGAVIV